MSAEQNLSPDDFETLLAHMNEKDAIELESLKQVYLKHVEANPTDTTHQLKLAHIHCLLNDLESASTQCEKLLKNCPTHAVARLMWMDILHQKGELNQAIEQGLKLLEQEPQSDVVCNNLGNIYADLGDYENAKLYFRKALEINPAYISVYNNLCLLLRDMGNYDDAINIGLIALSLDDTLLPAYNNIGICYQKKNDHQKALEYFDKALSIDSANPSLLYNCANSFLALSKKEEAQATLYKFFNLYQIDPNTLSEEQTKLFEQDLLVSKAFEKLKSCG